MPTPSSSSEHSEDPEWDPNFIPAPIDAWLQTRSSGPSDANEREVLVHWLLGFLYVDDVVPELIRNEILHSWLLDFLHIDGVFSDESAHESLRFWLLDFASIADAFETMQ